MARYLHQHKQPQIFLTLDITAFDSVSWPFLLEVLRKLGFGQIWCDIISGLLTSLSTQVILNGIPGERIQYRCGLRQGDLLPPMLFSYWSWMWCMSWWKRLQMRNWFNHLLEGPDNIGCHYMSMMWCFLLRSSAVDIGITLDILDLFGEASGLRTNIQKSSVLPIQCQQEDKDIIQMHLPCQM